MHKPMTALRVSNVTQSLAFYGDQLGFGIVMHDPTADVAQVDAAGYPILLAGPGAGDLTPHLHEVHDTVKPGTTLFAYAPDLDARYEALVERGAAGVTLVERPWGDRLIRVPDPDGYTVEFWTPLERTPREVLDLYAGCPDALEEVLAGLTEEDLDLAAIPETWSIRQIVHHVADSESALLVRILLALAEPGRVYHGSSYSQDHWAEGLAYAWRPVEPSVALFRAMRAQVVQLVSHVPDAWDRTIQSPEGRESSVGGFITMLTSHALEHVEEIRGIRHLQGR